MLRLVLVAALCATACAPKSPSSVESAMTAAVDVRRPPLDERAYRYFVLDNGMKALVVSDPDTDMAAAAVDVHVGQFADPADREGLAHFLEHMLFLGTDAYPDVDAYRDFVQSHGGRTNAGTGQEHTRYHFSVEHGHLEGALDRFSAFFTSPRLDREYVSREREAVNSEYRLKVQTQVRRFREVRRATSNPAHGFAKFSVGNLDTLADRPDSAVWDDLKAFYAEHYSASRMAVTVVGREDLDVLVALVRARFSAVPSDGAPVVRTAEPIHTADQLGVRIHVQPLEELRELYLEFPVPPELETYAHHPLELLTSLVGQEGPGSPHALLTERGWITGLRTASDGAEDHSLFTVRMTLTEDGLAHVDDVAGVIFDYARLLREAEDLRPYWDERRTLGQLAFRFREPEQAVGLARRSVRDLLLYPPENVLDHHAVWADWDETQLAAHLERLRPDNVRMFVTAPGLATDQEEARYAVPYGIQPLDPALMEQWRAAAPDPALALPAQNPFVPDDVELLAAAAADGTVPAMVIDEPGLRLWHLADTSFGVPRAVVSAQVHLLDAPTRLADAVNLRLWVGMVGQALAGPLDQARAAGIQPTLQQTADGLVVRVQGYDDKLPDVMQALVQGVVKAPPDPEVFELLRRDLVRRYRNTTTDRPIDQVGWALSESLDPSATNMLAAADHLDSLTLEQMEAWRAGLWGDTHVEVFAHGNLSAAAAQTLAEGVRSGVRQAGVRTPAPAVVRRVPRGRDLFRTVEVEHDDSAIRVLYQGEGTTLADQARWLMLGTLLQTPAFTQLRTEQQLGYVVWARYERRDHLPGLSVNIQSGVVGPDELLVRIEAFLDGYSQTLADMDAEQFETVKTGLIAKLEERPSTLGQKNRELAADLALGMTNFDRVDQIVALLKTLEKSEVEALLATSVRGAEARRLVVQATGRAHAGAPVPDGACADTACLVEKMDGTVDRPR